MLQLEQRFYSRMELAEILGVNINDSSHFARNVKDKLTKWGYGFDYKTEGATILSVPTTAEERLKEIAIRQFNIDVQTDSYAFACFISAINELEGFDSMPWETRAKVFSSFSGVKVSDRTLRSWCSKLLKKNAVSKTGGTTYWKTAYENGRKIQTQVTKEETESYYNRRSELVAELVNAGMEQREAMGRVYKCLWSEFNCCYYCCKGFLVTAFSDEELMREIIELTCQITQKAHPMT